MSPLCVMVIVFAICMAFVLDHEAKKKKKAREAAAAPVSPPAPVAAPVPLVPARAEAALPDWPLRGSLAETRKWLGAVSDSARAAFEVGAPVPIRDVEDYLDQGWEITAAITRKIQAIQASQGSELRRLPRKTRGYLERDHDNLRRLGGRLESLRDDLTDLIAAGGIEQPRRFRDLDDNIRALGRALQEFTS